MRLVLTHIVALEPYLLGFERAVQSKVLLQM